MKREELGLNDPFIVQWVRFIKNAAHGDLGHSYFFKIPTTEVILKKAPATDALRKLYSLYKQGAVGDATGKRPGMLDIRGRAKFDAWNGRKGMSSDDAMQAYVDFVDQLIAKQ